ncbi:hypothetical protein [Pseudanabaena sp. FACHB-2040]|uniref:hypothetical protein n=1 Tax=Pseudanabaena sp. FACHB-2040 TaxID=2692859 RepID=UPI0016828F39|nr:hypothetical protein [Pseudanabaena sp. FACHB-2040]MBD2259554.1 hypothetical protein [Pseudanabaena sp. FACHB-2040]
MPLQAFIKYPSSNPEPPHYRLQRLRLIIANEAVDKAISKFAGSRLQARSKHLFGSPWKAMAFGLVIAIAV